MKCCLRRLIQNAVEHPLTIFIKSSILDVHSLTAHDFSNLKAYNSTEKHNFICLSETYLDFTTPNSLLEIEGYNLVRTDHTNNIKRGGVCIYNKELLPVEL